MHQQIIQALSRLIGKTIAHVVVKAGRDPRAQVFLVFTDGTYYEWYADAPIVGTSTVAEGGLPEVRRYMEDQTIVFEI